MAATGVTKATWFMSELKESVVLEDYVGHKLDMTEIELRVCPIFTT